MNFKKTGTIMMATALLSSTGLSLYSSSQVKADSTDSNTLSVEKSNAKDKLVVTQMNKKFKEFSEEVSELEKQGLDSNSYDNKMQQLLIKYDGASVSLDTQLNASLNSMKIDGLISSSSQTGISICLVNGGVNTFGSSPMALGNLRTVFHDIGFYTYAIGSITDAVTSPNIAAVTVATAPYLTIALKAVSLLANWVYPKLMSVGDFYQSMLAKGFREGGVRLTFTDQFPIEDLFTQRRMFI